MSFPQLGYQYIRPLYPAERPGSGGSRGGAELAPSGTLSNVLSSMYGAPYAAAAAAQGYGAFLPYAAELPIFPQLVRGPRGSPLAPRGARFALGIGPGGAGGDAGRAVRGERERERRRALPLPCPGEPPERRGAGLERRPRSVPRSARGFDGGGSRSCPRGTPGHRRGPGRRGRRVPGIGAGALRGAGGSAARPGHRTGADGLRSR